MVIMLLLIPSDGDDPMLAQCCSSVVDYGPALNLHWVIVSWSLCGIYTSKDLKPSNFNPGSVIDILATVRRGDDRPELKRSLLKL